MISLSFLYDELGNCIYHSQSADNDRKRCGTTESFTVKDADGNIIGEVEPYYYGWS